MMEKVDKIKQQNLRQFEQEFINKIKDYDFKPGTLVQMRNMAIEKELDRKMYPRYLGPMIVIKRTKGGLYILADMNGAVKKEKVAAFRVLPHHARYEPIELPENIHDLIDLSKEQLEKMLETKHASQYDGEDFAFTKVPKMRRPPPGKEEVDEVMEEDELSSLENEETDEEIENKRKTRSKKMDGR
ncbi:hypothetical protein Moror_13397 [Moniliophthora roreri MCA 2997]|uniref:Uncharacterized protein n=1 Tax=Moniliophthora roreri (strain MCA 2997) TaxID=1381753 RepID=V2XRJ1_MONRO|nr:hypothetical protein Moror_13397 [Moniliophthora roreri MCA 2997]